METTVLIPAYRPDARLPELVAALAAFAVCPVLVVDDGSGAQYAPVFAEAEANGAVLLRHAENRGKGAAIKTGLRYLRERQASGAVTADADGQHSAADIARLCEAMAAHPDTFIVGGRDFAKMPLRSRAGNTITSFFFRLSTGLRIRDTQTGLRGFPACLFDRLLAVEGDRYEYEMNMLLALPAWHAPYLEIPIETIYLDDNRSSHFHALRDGARVFSRLIKYTMSSLATTVVDYAAFWILLNFLQPAPSYAVARTISSVVNYEINRRVVFKAQSGVKSALGYAALVLFGMGAGSATVAFLTNLGMNSTLAKFIIDNLLFILNYFVQKRVIFKGPPQA